MTPETNKNAVLLAKLDELINESLENSNSIGMTLCAARKRISDQSDRIAELWEAMEILRRERDEAREEIRDWKRLHDNTERGVDLTIAEGTISDLLKQRDEARELVKTYKDYAQLLGDEINEMAVFASVHGWKSSRIEQGKVLREKIKQLEKP